MEDYAFPYVYPEEYKNLLDFVKDQIAKIKIYRKNKTNCRKNIKRKQY